MPFASRHRDDPAPRVAPVPGLHVRREASADVMAALQGRSVEEMAVRFAAGHRAYVALRDGEPAAWGWVATRAAHIGELDAAIALPRGERYLWNFVTLAAHRGLGIYPALLEEIIREESREAERFWIAWAPENHASASGIRKAGFAAVAELSFDAAGRPALRAMVEGGETAAARVLGLPVAEEALALCWRCVRAAAKAAPPAATRCHDGACECDYQRPISGCAA
ncbi:MAG TPA: GNAT family N-acetyltransferase [Gemmatimonadaceae bacterium]|nr:GNAT family N-acetyltransferase [Gemmatimonadaceae bacterium]